MQKNIERFQELWAYAKKNYPLPGNGLPWLYLTHYIPNNFYGEV